jgi:hypothetical protein
VLSRLLHSRVMFTWLWCILSSVHFGDSILSSLPNA